jgi:hypothetical protein
VLDARDAPHDDPVAERHVADHVEPLAGHERRPPAPTRSSEGVDRA